MLYVFSFVCNVFLVYRYQQQRKRRDSTEDAGLVGHIHLNEVIDSFYIKFVYIYMLLLT